jgi:multiple sugar transport system ATP-binding protein
VLLLKALSKSFGKQRVLDSFTASVDAAEVLALIGPSGSGKTTLLRLIAGLESPDSGTIDLDGADITAVPPSARSVSLMFQTPMLYPFMRVRENLFLSAAAPDESTYEEIVEILCLGPLLMRRPRQLSGGEAQRVLLGKMLLHKSSISLMDEPLSELDPVLASELRAWLPAYVKSQRRHAVFVTHNQDEAIQMGDRIAIINSGVLHQIGQPTEIFEEPATGFVAAFFGDPGLKLFRAQTQVVGSTTIVTVPACGVRFRIDRILPHSTTGLKVAFRNVKVCRASSLSLGGDAGFRIVAIRRRFNDLLASIVTPEGMWSIATTANDWSELSNGASVQIGFAHATLFLFSEDSDRLLYHGPAALAP